MYCSRFLVSTLFAAAAYSWTYDWPSSGDTQWLDGNMQQVIGVSCTTSHLTAFQMSKTKDPIFFSTSGTDHFVSPKMLPLNGTAGEQWEFDGVSNDGMMTFVFGFYRDPNYAILGSGNLRVSVEMAFVNETRFAQVDYPSDSILEECEWGTRGTWKSKDYGYTFEISRDMSKARVGMDTPLTTGTVTIRSATKPRYPDGNLYPSENSTSEAMPYFHFVKPIPAGTADVDLMFQGEKYAWSGLGGMGRLWGAFSWFTCMQGMNIVRILAGPYALSLFSFTSNIRKRIEYPSVGLFENGQKIVSSQRTTESDTEDYFAFTKTYGGKVTGTLRDKVTGYEIELVSPSKKKHYTFLIEHKNLGFEYILGGGHGGSGFSGLATGGPVGREQYQGIAMTEALTFPIKSPLFRSQYSE